MKHFLQLTTVDGKAFFVQISNISHAMYDGEKSIITVTHWGNQFDIAVKESPAEIEQARHEADVQSYLAEWKLSKDKRIAENDPNRGVPYEAAPTSRGDWTDVELLVKLLEGKDARQLKDNDTSLAKGMILVGIVTAAGEVVVALSPETLSALFNGPKG